MRPYFAIIADSFHSALSSRILWVAFIAIWAFLAILAPVGYQEDFTTKFSFLELYNGTQLKATLARGLIDPAEEKTALGRIVRAFPDDLQEKLKRVGKDDIRVRKEVLAGALNELLEDESWYDEEAWKPTLRFRELRELDITPSDELTESQKMRRARLRIEAALPGIFPARASTSIMLSYAGLTMPSEVAFSKEQFLLVANQVILPLLMNWLLGLALIFLGILVTASMIPDMLQPGSLHLLLSKPISRSMLLLSKFIGGCAFVFLCVSQLVVGLYLIAGFRLDIWNARILWCIPVSVFLFAVYFSVSLLAGLRWRSPILSIGVTCIFAAVVILVGFVGGIFESSVREPDKIQNIAVAGDSIIVSTRGGAVKRWNESQNGWEKVVDDRNRGADIILSPVVLDQDHIATARITGGRFNSYGSGTLSIMILSRGDQWRPESGLRLPIATRKLIAVGNESILALNNSGLTVVPQKEVLESAGLDDESDPDSDESDDEKNEEAEKEVKEDLSGWLKSLMRMQGGPTEQFRPILPQGIYLSQPTRIELSEDTQFLTIYSRGRVMRFQMPDSSDQRAEILKQETLDGDSSQPAVMALSGKTLVIARDDETPMLLNAETFETITELTVSETDAMVASIIGLGTRNQFAVLLSDGTVSIVKESSGQWTTEPTRFKDVTGIAYDRLGDRLAVGHSVDQLDMVTIDDLSAQFSARPTLSSWRFADRYVVTPIRTMIPQTVELTGTVAALISGKSSFAMTRESDQEREVVRQNVLTPVISCSIFIVVMLVISCLYFSRRDF